MWFTFDQSRPLACFAGIWTNWTKGQEGETTNDSSKADRATMQIPVGTKNFSPSEHAYRASIERQSAPPKELKEEKCGCRRCTFDVKYLRDQLLALTNRVSGNENIAESPEYLAEAVAVCEKH